MPKVFKQFLNTDIGAAIGIVFPGLISFVLLVGGLHGIYLMFTITAPALTKVSIVAGIFCKFFLIYYCVVLGYRDFFTGK